MSANSLRRWRRSLPPRGGRHILGACLTLLLGLLATPAHGQGAHEAVGTDGTLTIEVRKGQVIRLPQPAATVFVAAVVSGLSAGSAIATDTDLPNLSTPAVTSGVIGGRFS